MSPLVVILILAVAVTLIVVMSFLWRHYYGTDKEVEISEEEIEIIASEIQGFGFEPLSVRPLFGARVIWSKAARTHEDLLLELCDGGWRDYTRLTCRFRRSLGQGISFRSEPEGLSLMGLFYSLHEVETGDRELDRGYFVLAREDDRLSDLVHSRIRHSLVAMREEVETIRFSDVDLHVTLDDVVRGEKLKRLIERILYLAADLRRWSEEKGPLPSLHTGQYQDALAEMDMGNSRTQRVQAIEGIEGIEQEGEALPIQPSEFDEVDAVTDNGEKRAPD